MNVITYFFQCVPTGGQCVNSLQCCSSGDQCLIKVREEYPALYKGMAM